MYGAPPASRRWKEDAIVFCGAVMKYLDGHALISNATTCAAPQVDPVPARRHQTVHHNGRAPVVLMGDAAHRAFRSAPAQTRARDASACALHGRVVADLPESLPAASGI
jgi:anthraniloyl-CoA monooxygenase